MKFKEDEVKIYEDIPFFEISDSLKEVAFKGFRK